MLPGMNSRDMKKMMKKMGVNQTDLEATEVIIRLKNKDLVFSNPQVAKVKMMGQETYQITGNPEEREQDNTPDISEDDIQTVVEQTGVGEEAAKQAIKEADGDLAAAILSLSGE